MYVAGISTTHMEKANFGDHAHKYYELIYSRSDLVHMTLDGKEYKLTPGYITVIPPNCVHSQYSDCPYTDTYILALSTDFQEPVVVYDANGEIKRILDIMLEIANKEEAYQQAINSRLLDSICFIIKKLSKNGQTTSTYDDAVQNFANLLKEQISNEKFDVGTALEHIGYNANYFRRTFKKNFGETPLEYLTQLRIANAKQLLTIDSYKSISDVAAQCGFSDNLYFSTCFKKHVGMSPLKYRNLILSHVKKPK